MRIEAMMGMVLRVGVALAAAVGIAGGVMYLAQGAGAAQYGEFRGPEPRICTLGGIIQGAFAGQSGSVVQLGVLLLVATPIARVTLGLVMFARQRDWIYVAVTVIVLTVLGYSLLGQGV